MDSPNQPQNQPPGNNPPPPSGGFPPPPQPGYNYPPQQPGYNYPPQQPGYNYPPQQPGYNYPPQQPGGYPPQPYGYGPPPMQQPQKKGANGCLIAFLIVFALLLVGGGIATFTISSFVKKVNNEIGLTGPGYSGPREKLYACKLLTATEAATVLGKDATVEDNGASCTYQSSDQTGFIQLTMDYGNKEDFALQRRIFSGLGNAFAKGQPTAVATVATSIIGDGKIQEISGLGDEAFWTGSFLYVRKGNKYFGMTSFAFLSDSQTPTLDKLKDLAQKAVSRI